MTRTTGFELTVANLVIAVTDIAGLVVFVAAVGGLMWVLQ